MDEQEFYNYFEGLATGLKDIGHDFENGVHRFFHADEFVNALKNRIDYGTFVMSVTNEQGRMAEVSTDTKEIHLCSFAIVQKVKQQDYRGIRQAFSDCLSVCRKILSKMILDLEENDGLMCFLDESNIGFEKIHFKGDNAFGWEISFSLTIKNRCDYNFKPEDWNE